MNLNKNEMEEFEKNETQAILEKVAVSHGCRSDAFQLFLRNFSISIAKFEET